MLWLTTMEGGGGGGGAEAIHIYHVKQVVCYGRHESPLARDSASTPSKKVKLLLAVHIFKAQNSCDAFKGHPSVCY